jgi:hypothetical protein
MELVGATHGVIVNDPHLQQSLIRDSQRSHPPRPNRERNFRIRHWLALALHGLASRIDPAVRAPELLTSNAARQTVMAVGELP